MSVVKPGIDTSLLKRFSPLDELDQDNLAELAAKSTVLALAKGDTVSAKTAKNSMVFLLSGTVDRAPGSEGAETIKAKTDRARRAIFSPSDRARVVAKSDVTVLCIDSQLLDFLSSWGEGADGKDTGIVVDEIEATSGDWVDGLMRSDVVTNLSPSSIQALMASIDPVEVGADEVIFHQGDAPDYYYIVSRGRCVVTRRDPGLDTPVDLATLGPGGAFGEEALITNAPRNATVRMIENGIVLRLRQSEFKKMLEQPLVRTIDGDELSSLKATGAVMLYIRSGDESPQAEEGITMPLALLRERMNQLTKGRTYIVLSDNERVSAAAAFLLSQKRFNACVLKNTTKQEPVAKAEPPSSAPVAALQATAIRLEQELHEIKAKLKAEQQQRAAVQDRVRALETDLKTTRAGAKAAITASDSLKVRAESLLRQQMTALSKALEQEQQTCETLNSENRRLNQQLAYVQNELQLTQQQAEQFQQEGQSREAQFSETINQLEESLAEQSDRVQHVQGENHSLQNQHVQLESRYKQLAEEEQSLQDQHADLDKRFQQLVAAHQSLQQQHVELESSFEQLSGEKHSLSIQLNDANQHLERRAELINGLQGELKTAVTRADSTAQALATLQAHYSELEVRLEQGQQQIAQLEKTHTELYFRVQSVTRESQEQARAAVEQRQTLEKNIAGLNATLNDTTAAFNKAEADHKQHIDKLGRALTDANKNVVRLTDLSTKQESHIRTLTDETNTLQTTKKRRGLAIATLTLLLLLATGGVVASLMGIDLRGTATAIIQPATALLSSMSVPSKIE